MIQPPCKKSGQDCEKRHPGCHSSCPEYKEFEEAKREERRLIAEQKKQSEDPHFELWAKVKRRR